MIAHETRVSDFAFLFLALEGQGVVRQSGISEEAFQQGHLIQLNPFSMSQLQCHLARVPCLNW